MMPTGFSRLKELAGGMSHHEMAAQISGLEMAVQLSASSARRGITMGLSAPPKEMRK